ncbi:MAG: LPD5 domain-containing protein, partial [Mesotoga sp.]|uniref:LPD5 domain-containing protein n=1 Tax=Mesotoga sp. TaxID=2053577 RepID=UPI003566E04C
MPENAVLFPKYEQLYQNDLVENDVPLDSQPIDIVQKAKEAVEKDKAIDPNVKPKKGDKIAFEIGGREVKFDYDSFISDKNGTLTYDYFGMKTLKPGEYRIERGGNVINVKQENGSNTKLASTEEREVSEKIEDFGEKIEGAKKDTWKRNEATTDEIKSQPLSKTFPRPDFAKLANDGQISVDGAIILKYLYDSISSKPRKASKVVSWAQRVQGVIDVMNSFIDVPSRVKSYLDAVNGMPEYNKRPILIYIEVQKLLGFPSEDINMGKYEVKKFSGRDGYSIVNSPYIVGDYKTIEEAAKALKKMLKANKEASSKDEVKLSLYQDTETKKYFIGKKGAVGVVRLIDNIETLEEARTIFKEQQPQLQEMWRALKVKLEERRTTNRARVGTDYRNGKNISPEEFSETFGFRGVQFGNWVNSQERQESLNDAFDALMDLSTAIGVSTRAISLNGELGLAFGARGSGKFNAHYEPGQIVINLTKTKGAGSLAHEWWHALDNYFSRSRGERSSYLTEKPRQGRSMTGQMDERIRKEMIDAFKNLTTVINKSGIPKRSKELDKTRSKAYWSTIVEMSARAFENFIIEKMAQTNESNDYLANFKELSEWTDQGSLDVGSYPYPTKEETETINAAYQELFDTIQEKVDEETGDVLLFRSMDEAGFYSTVEDALEKIKQEKGTPEQFKAMLLKNGAKQAELDWMGWDERFPDGKQTISKTDIQDWIDQNRIEVPLFRKRDTEAREAYAMREWNRAKRAIDELAAKMGVSVEIIETTDGLPKAKAEAKGWYDVKKKEITIVMPNHTSSWDAQATLLHEAVGHYGLR